VIFLGIAYKTSRCLRLLQLYTQHAIISSAAPMTMLASTINPEYTKYNSFTYRDAYDERWLASARGLPCVGLGISANLGKVSCAVWLTANGCAELHSPIISFWH
jgi:hypothetical protein